jgi:transcriptional regulator with XRE-family HTH domain
MKKQLTNKIALSAIEKKLQELDADDIFELCEPMPLSDDELKYLKSNVSRAAMERVLVEAKSQISYVKLSFGRYLQLIRDKSELTVQNIASLLKKEQSYITKIENGQIDPLKIPFKEMADIMQLFRINLTELKTSIEAFLKISPLKGKRVAGMARSTGKQGATGKADTLSHAMDAVLQKIATKKTSSSKVIVDSKYINLVKTELQKRKDNNLLV